VDENLAEFLNQFIPMPEAAPFPESSLRKYAGVVPAHLLEIWSTLGLCGFNAGAFWLTDPDQYTELMAVLLDGKTTCRPEECTVFARSAFGHLHVWYERVGTFYISMADLKLNIGSAGQLMLSGKRDLKPSCHLLCLDRFEDPSLDIMDESAKYLLKRTQKKLGPLAADECYGFFPALPFGGTRQLDHLQVVKQKEHLMMLAQMDVLRIFDVSEFPPRQIE
jgi:hypothetical protein